MVNNKVGTIKRNYMDGFLTFNQAIEALIDLDFFVDDAVEKVTRWLLEKHKMTSSKEVDSP